MIFRVRTSYCPGWGLWFFTESRNGNQEHGRDGCPLDGPAPPVGWGLAPPHIPWGGLNEEFVLSQLPATTCALAGPPSGFSPGALGLPLTGLGVVGFLKLRWCVALYGSLTCLGQVVSPSLATRGLFLVSSLKIHLLRWEGLLISPLGAADNPVMLS